MSIDYRQVLLFLYAMMIPFSINLGGKLSVADIIALMVLPLVNWKVVILRVHYLKPILSCIFLLLLVQVLSDIYNQSSFYDFSRGWATYVFLVVNLLFLTFCMYKSPSNVVFFVFSLFISRLLFGAGDLNFDIIGEDSNFFKVRFSGFLTMFCLLISVMLIKCKSPNLAILVFFGFSLIFMVFDARSMGVILLFSSIVMLFSKFYFKINVNRVFVYIIVSSPIIYFAYYIYVGLVLSGDIGGYNSVYQFSQMSNPYNPFELLYFGRSELAVLLQAGLDSPLLGHGSWAVDTNNKYGILKEQITGTSSEYKGYIIAHSILLGVFAYSGFVAFLLAFYFIYKIITYIYYYLKNYSFDFMTPIVVFFSIDFLWVWLFSPLSALRTTVPLSISIIVACLYFKEVSENEQ